MAIGRSKGRWLVAGVVLLCLGLGAWRYRLMRLREQRIEQAAKVRAELLRCWLGPALAEGETWAERWRRRDLARAFGMSEPKDCAQRALRLIRLLREDDSATAKRLEKAFSCQPSCSLPNQWGQAEPARKLVEGLSLPSRRATTAAATLAPRLPRSDRFASLVEAGFVLHDRQRRPDGRQLLLWAGPLGRIEICQLAGRDAFSCQAHRLTLDAKLRTEERLRWRLHRGSERLLLIDVHGRVRDLQGKEVRHVAGVADGALVQRQRGGFAVARVSAGRLLAKDWLDEEELGGRPVAVGHDLVYSQSKSAGGDLVWRRMRAVDSLFSDAQTLGAAQQGRPRLCQRGNSAVLMWGREQPTALAFRDGNGRWQPLVVVDSDLANNTKAADPKAALPKARTRPARTKKMSQAAGQFGMAGLLGQGSKELAASPWDALPSPSPAAGAPTEENSTNESKRDLRFVLRPKRPFVPRLRPFSMRCQDGKLSYTYQKGATLWRWLCTPQGCKQQRVQLGRWAKKTVWTAASLGFKADDPVALVWEAPSGVLVAKVASPMSFEQAPPIWLFDDPSHGGPATRDAQVLVGEGRLTLVFRSRGVHALQLDAKGRVHTLGQQAGKPKAGKPKESSQPAQAAPSHTALP